jgi:hypothetical protein
MADRTLQFCGYAYGNVPVQLNAHINGQLVFGGAVTTVDEPLPAPDINMANAPPLFSVTNSLFSTAFSGSYPMTVTVGTAGEGIYLSAIKSNYMANISSNTAGTVTTFLPCFTGTPVNSESTPDPRSSVTLNDSVQVPPNAPSQGCWTWLVTPGSTLAHNLNISVGNVA